MKSVRTSRYSLSIVIGKYWKYLSTRWKKHATCATSINFQGCQLSNGEAWTRDRLCMKSSSFENMMASALSWALDGHGHGCYGSYGSHRLVTCWECDAEDFKVWTCLYRQLGISRTPAVFFQLYTICSQHIGTY